MRRIIREVEPPEAQSSAPEHRSSAKSAPPSARARHIEPEKLSRMVEPDLDWIVMKAIEKDRTRRYETANGLALDIQRFLADEPVSAGPPGAGYEFRKFARRNKTALRVAAAIAAVLVAATVCQHMAGGAREPRAPRNSRTEKRGRKDRRAKTRKPSPPSSPRSSKAPTRRATDATITVAEMLDRAAKKLETDLASQPERRATAAGRARLDLPCARPLLARPFRCWKRRGTTTMPPPARTASTPRAMGNLANSYARPAAGTRRSS